MPNQQIDTTGNGVTTVANQEAALVAALPGESAALAASKTAAAARPAGPGTPNIALVQTNVSGAVVLDGSRYMNYDFALVGNVTLSVTKVSSDARYSFNVVLRQDATGSRTLTAPAGTKWLGGVAGVASTAAGSIDTLNLVTYDGGVTFFASLSKAFA